MNKAFVREPDDNGQRYCPACGSLGIAVSAETWRAHVKSPLGVQLAESAYFCTFARCEVVYFDEVERVVKLSAMAGPVWPKDADAPLCGCFGFTRDDVDDDIRSGGVKRVRELLEKAKSPAAACRVKSPSGQCCVAEVQRYFLRRRGESGVG
jgi:hypothetical protein